MSKKWLLPIFLVLTVILVSACGNNSNNNNGAASPSASSGSSPSASASEPAASPSESDAASGTITYQSETGPVEVPANPQRIVALGYAPNVISMGGTLVGVDEWTNMSPHFTEKLKGVEVVSEDNLEKIIELDPDLIIVDASSKSIDKLKEIAPTVAFTWGKLDYLQQQIEIGKMLNKEAEAQAWADDFTKRAKEIGDQIKAKIGESATVSVFETDSKNFYVFGDAWARGTEILYQAMGLNMPEKVKADALGAGYYTLSPEVLSDYAGDYIVLSRSASGDNSFMETDTWKKIPAVANGHLIEIDTEASTYSDPTTLEYLLNIFKDAFLK
ncbi:iron-hydroxamate ABC transporter substrate-binding protein [Cohnella thailandensis]|uniref:Iron-hydroxamate ABC transporter substrate-binding protein n=1 Tax=Cohnella thailandensis TaxID=557557 RepID=A0A841SSN3_9BACL|nr:iron-hydroxamate ABC transporter substrate-binding protein [Cohnella thailandensis]MBB6633065.1 iron-hydroxamate ABC transporter substrate-binding protein [Cohnella thailandensis]MBP1975240.1 iron complex transport system substrate-binding protein [Cohnella thailandensis]